MSRGALIEPDSEGAGWEAALRKAIEGRGSLALPAGEAVWAKARFVEEAVGSADTHSTDLPAGQRDGPRRRSTDADHPQ